MTVDALRDVEVVLLDADGNLFPSEEPAFEASTVVTNRLLADLGVAMRFDPDELRRIAVGRNFRATAADLAASYGAALPDEELERRVAEEQREVMAHLGRVLGPDPRVSEPVRRLSRAFGLAVVSSSALARLDVCFEATGLAELLPASRRFSAEDSLPAPTSKPDPAVYVHAGKELGVEGGRAVAIEDAAAGVRSAVGAGFPCVGNLLFVPDVEREERRKGLLAAGALAVVEDLEQLEGLLPAGVTAGRGREGRSPC